MDGWVTEMLASQGIIVKENYQKKAKDKVFSPNITKTLCSDA